MDWNGILNRIESGKGPTTEERAIEAADSSHLDLQKFGAYLAAQGLDASEGPQPDSQSDLKNCGALADLGGDQRATLYRP